MPRPDQKTIETFTSITGASEPVAIRKLEEHAGDLNQAVNAHFNEGNRNIVHDAPVVVPEDDLMEIDDPTQFESRGPAFPLLPSARNMNPFSVLDPNLGRNVFDGGTELPSAAPIVSHPREVREIPIEVKNGDGQSGHSGRAPIVQDVTETAHEHGPEIHGTVKLDDEDDDVSNSRPNALASDGVPDYGNEIEEEMIRAAIEASKRDAEIGYPGQSDPVPRQSQSRVEDAELAHVVSLSLKTAEQEKAVRELVEKGGSAESEASKSPEVEEIAKLASSNGRLEVGSSSVQDETEDVEEQPLVRRRSRPMSSGSVDTVTEIGDIEVSPPSSPRPDTNSTHPQPNENDHLDEWGGISSLEHDEAVMLEAALFGGIPERSSYHVPYAPPRFMQNDSDDEETMGPPYPRPIPHPPSPSLTAQRLIREQQDDEYLASLQADREKELKAREEEQAAREAALVEERRKEEELNKKLEEERELERQLVAKEASLPHEPASDDENAVTLLVRMPDGSRRGRRFLKSHKLQYFFDFIDIGRVVKPGTYRLVRPYPMRAFSDGESTLTLNELGLTSRQEALFIDLI